MENSYRQSKAKLTGSRYRMVHIARKKHRRLKNYSLIHIFLTYCQIKQQIKHYKW